MPPKKINVKALEAADRRAEQDAEKQRKKAMEDEKKEAEEWSVGANAKAAAKAKVQLIFDVTIVFNNV
jgi:hypothetical protein